jgi:molecular chaperone DnaJ
VYGEETLSIDIPAGAQEGMQLSMSGRGNAGERGGPAGDLLLVIEEEKHPQLFRHEQDVVFQLHLSFPDAVLGTSVEVPTIDGKAKIKIPAGTQSGKIFRLKGKGFPTFQSSDRGDELVEVNVWSPQHLSNEEKDLLEKLKNSPNFNPGPDAGNENKERSFFDRIRNAWHN